MKRRIIKIDRELCNGCGACASACHEGAIVMSEGKALLAREDYCDGLGDCLPACPVGAISFEHREAEAYNEDAVRRSRTFAQTDKNISLACPGTRALSLDREERSGPGRAYGQSRLRQWPCQIKLVPPEAPYFDGAHLLLAADCTAYAYGNFHNDFMNNRITLIGCPKLDS